MQFIMESLLIGNIYDAQDPPPFVTALLWAAIEPRISAPQRVAFARIPLHEYAEADPIDIEAGVDWIDRHLSTNRTLVCCRAGMGRSVSIVIAYLCCIKGMRYEEAVQLVLARQPSATPIPNLEQTIEKVQKLRQIQPRRA